MRKFSAGFFLATGLSAGLIAGPVTGTRAAELTLGNEPWPPFVLEGEERGSAEAIVCEGLQRAGHDCTIVYDSWDTTLEQASTGALDGVAAIWFTPERGERLVYSTPYLTNRLVTVTAVGGPAIRRIADLDGRKVALESAVAYGDELLAAKDRFEVVEVQGSEGALAALRAQQAEVAIVDELFARELIEGGASRDFVIGDVALAYRELHFAMSRQHPRAQAVVAGFNEAYQAMLRDGTVNRILDIDWVATDLGADGVMDFIHRGKGFRAAISDAAAEGQVYALEQGAYDQLRDPGFVGSNANFLADEEVYETPEAAMRALDTERRCSYDSMAARIVCTGR